MKIDIKKRNKSWNITIKCKDKSIKFDYIQFINMLYRGEELEEIIFEPEIVEEEKNQIIEMIKEINNTVKLELKDVSKGENWLAFCCMFLTIYQYNQ
mgnify:CR=1 FL=1